MCALCQHHWLPISLRMLPPARGARAPRLCSSPPSHQQDQRVAVGQVAAALCHGRQDRRRRQGVDDVGVMVGVMVGLTLRLTPPRTGLRPHRNTTSRCGLARRASAALLLWARRTARCRMLQTCSKASRGPVTRRAWSMSPRARRLPRPAGGSAATRTQPSPRRVRAPRYGAGGA